MNQKSLIFENGETIITGEAKIYPIYKFGKGDVIKVNFNLLYQDYTNHYEGGFFILYNAATIDELESIDFDLTFDEVFYYNPNVFCFNATWLGMGITEKCFIVEPSKPYYMLVMLPVDLGYEIKFKGEWQVI